LPLLPRALEDGPRADREGDPRGDVQAGPVREAIAVELTDLPGNVDRGKRSAGGELAGELEHAGTAGDGIAREQGRVDRPPSTANAAGPAGPVTEFPSTVGVPTATSTLTASHPRLANVLSSITGDAGPPSCEITPPPASSLKLSSATIRVPVPPVPVPPSFTPTPA
jgi:hypothetical protein